MQECTTFLFHRKKTKGNLKNVRKTCYWKLIFVICSYSTWARRYEKQARHVITWARKHIRQVGTWAGKHARHAGTWARKHARQVDTWARKARNLADSIKDEILATALNFSLAFLRSPSMCSSKLSLLSIFIPKNFLLHVLERFSLQISFWWPFITKKKVKFTWIHFHTVIPKSQSKAFNHTLNLF